MMRFMALIAGVLLAQPAHAAEITVLSGGAVEPGLKAAVAAFEKESGHTVKITFNTTPQILKRVAGGEAFDVVVAPPSAIREFGARVEEPGVDIGRVGSGVAVRTGAPAPDISSADAVKRAVLDAESVVFNRASTGIYIENMLRKMGVYDQIESKTTRYPDAGAVMEHVAKGKGREVAFGPITEILLYKDKGVRLVGPLPAEIQNYTAYTAVPMTGRPGAQAARSLVTFLGGSRAKPLFAAAGID
jgi:molybdate transport system substrate-binding protein